MRLPVRSETDAFRIAVGVALLTAIAVAVGAAAAPLYGVAVFAGGVLGGFLLDVAVKEPPRDWDLRAAAVEARSRPSSTRQRILVVANETLGGEEFREEVLGRSQPRLELRVVAPVLVSRAHLLTSDVDAEIEEARGRLDATLRWAAQNGFPATGNLGDSDPVTAIADELRQGPVDEVIITTHPPERSNWLEADVVQRARRELDIPVTHVVVDVERQRVAVASA